MRTLPGEIRDRRLEDHHDPRTGVRLGIRPNLVQQQASDANGAKWTSPTGTIQIQTGPAQGSRPVTAKLAVAREEGAGAQHRLPVVKPDFFVLSGLQGLKNFLPPRHL